MAKQEALFQGYDRINTPNDHGSSGQPNATEHEDLNEPRILGNSTRNNTNRSQDRLSGLDRVNYMRDQGRMVQGLEAGKQISTGLHKNFSQSLTRKKQTQAIMKDILTSNFQQMPLFWLS